MVASARTAPKAAEKDNITTAIVTGEDKERLADKLAEMASLPNAARDYSKEIMNIRNADAVVLIGVKIEDETERTLRRSTS
jgi:uncharacterized ferredoxin-like protein